MNTKVQGLVKKAIKGGNKNPSNEQLRTLAFAVGDKESMQFFKKASVKELAEVRTFIKQSAKEKTSGSISDLVDESDREEVGRLVSEGNTSGQLAPGDDSGRNGSWEVKIDMWNEEKEDVEPDDSDLEHVGHQIAEGYSSGELSPGDERGLQGWWELSIEMWKEASIAAKEKTAAGVALIYDLAKMISRWDPDEGADPGNTQDMGPIDNGVAHSSEELFKKLESITGKPKEDWFVFDNRVETNQIEDSDGDSVDTKEEEDLAKSTGRPLWIADYDAFIEFGDGSEVTPEKLSSMLGIPIEDSLSSGAKPHVEEVSEEGVLSSKKVANVFGEDKPEATGAEGGDLFGLDQKQSKIAYDDQKGIYTYPPEERTAADDKDVRARDEKEVKHPDTSDVKADVATVQEALAEKPEFPQILSRGKTSKDALKSESVASKKTADDEKDNNDKDGDKKDNELEMGKEVEAEHAATYDKIKKAYEENGEWPDPEEVYEWIAKDHIGEFDTYYTALKDMESELKKKAEPKEPKEPKEPMDTTPKKPEPKEDMPEEIPKEKPEIGASKKASLAENIHGAEYIEHDPDRGILYVWHGGDTINVVSEETGDDVDVWTMGGGDPNTKKTKEDVRQSIENHKEYMADQEGTEASKKASKNIPSKKANKKTAMDETPAEYLRKFYLFLNEKGIQKADDEGAEEAVEEFIAQEGTEAAKKTAQDMMSGEQEKLTVQSPNEAPMEMVIVGQDPAGQQIAVPENTEFTTITKGGTVIGGVVKKAQNVQKS